MADTVREIVFKKMTDAEVVSGGVFDVVTTNNTTALVIKDVETTQGNNDDAVVATLSVGTAANRYNVQTYNKTVTVSGGNFLIDGTANAAIDLVRRSTYIFDVSDSSNATHILAFSTTSDGSHGGGSEYTTGVTRNGTPGQAGATVTIVVASDAPATLYYYCTAHSGMGGTSNTRDATVAEQKFSSLGTVAAKDTIGASGSAIMDSDSVLSLRTTAKAMTFTDTNYFIDNTGTAQPKSTRNIVIPRVNGNAEAQTNTILDASASSSHTSYNYVNNIFPEWTAIYTRQDGGRILMRGRTDNSNWHRLAVMDADSTTVHRDLDTTYNQKLWLGDRYIWWYEGNGNMRYYDLEDSNQTANYHGTFTLSYAGFNSGASYYANHTYAMTYGRGGRPVLFGNTAPTSQSNNYKTMVYIEGPDMTPYQSGTHANGAQWLQGDSKYRMDNDGYSDTNVTDAFGRNGNFNHKAMWVNNTPNRNANAITWNTRLNGYIAWHRNNSGSIYAWFYPDSTPNSFGTNAMGALHYDSIGDMGWATSLWQQSNNMGEITQSKLIAAGASGLNSMEYANFWAHEDKIWVARGNSNTNVPIYEVDLVTGAITKISEEANNYYGRFIVTNSTPTAATIAQRTYLKKPSLSVRIAGVQEDRS